MRRILIFTLVLAAWAGTAVAQEADTNYRIGIDDSIQIKVWNRDDLSGVFVVDEEGNINLPLIGAVQAEGTTTGGLARSLERRFVVMDPSVSQVLVTVTGFNSRRFKVVGEVRVPGVYRFRKIPTLWDVILTAGGETQNADMSAVQIVREVDDSGNTETITVDLSDGIENTPLSAIPVLEPGDSVVIPGLESIGVTGDQVQVLGSVRTPGVYSLRFAETVVEAISISGGHLQSADLSDVRLTRREGDGAVVYQLNLRDYLKHGYPPADLSLKAGDTLLIPGGGGSGGFLRTILQFSGVLSGIAGLVLAADRL